MEVGNRLVEIRNNHFATLSARHCGQSGITFDSGNVIPLASEQLCHISLRSTDVEQPLSAPLAEESQNY